MKHPVLHVRKGAEIYDDENPEGARSVFLRAREKAERPSQAGPPPRGRRVRLSFFPLLLVALALFAVYHFTPRGPQDRATIAGWQVILRATPNDGSLIVGVTFIAPGTGPVAGVPLARVHVTLPDTGGSLELSGPLSKSPMTLRGVFADTQSANRVVADVSIGEKSARLTLRERSTR
jgi:hypothetical protein